MGFIRIYNAGELKKELELTAPRTTIGRTSDNDIVLSEDGVSRHHAVISKSENSFYIEDTESRNGVFLNKKRVKREKLTYWDEIQIQNYVIKFMAVAGLRSADDGEVSDNAKLNTDSTMFVALTDEQQLEKLRNKSRKAYLTYSDGDTNVRKNISGVRLTIGRSKNSDIRLQGWFTPALAASIEKQGSQYLLIPHRRGKVIVDEEQIHTPTQLRDGARFEVRGKAFKFFHRLTDK